MVSKPVQFATSDPQQQTNQPTSVLGMADSRMFAPHYLCVLQYFAMTYA